MARTENNYDSLLGATTLVGNDLPYLHKTPGNNDKLVSDQIKYAMVPK